MFDVFYLDARFRYSLEFITVRFVAKLIVYKRNTTGSNERDADLGYAVRYESLLLHNKFQLYLKPKHRSYRLN